VAGTTYAGVVGQLRRLLSDAAAYRQMAAAVNPYGDGQAARRIADIIECTMPKLGD